MSPVGVALRRGRDRLLGLDAGDAAHPIVGVQVDHPHPHGITPLARDVAPVDPDHLALGRDHEDVVALAALEHPDHGAVSPLGFDVDDALACAALEAVLLERRALAVAALGDREDADAFLHHLGGDDLIAVVHLDPADTAGRAAHGPDIFLGEADDHALLGREKHRALAVG